MLGVSSDARGRGVGRALVVACLDRARRDGARRVVLSTEPVSTTAHRLYEGLGFRREPALDWTPVPSVDLIACVLDLAADAEWGADAAHPSVQGWVRPGGGDGTRPVSPIAEPTATPRGP